MTSLTLIPLLIAAAVVIGWGVDYLLRGGR